MTEFKIKNWLGPKKVNYPDLGVVHIWLIDTSKNLLALDQYRNFIHQDNFEKYNSINNNKTRIFRLHQHYLLLKTLSMYLNKSEKEILLNFNQFNKPYLNLDVNFDQIFFNTSHSDNYLALAISFDSEIGIDIEKPRENIDFNKIINRFFSEREKFFFSSLKKEHKFETFFQWWTMKEAIVKATGKGLYLPFNKFNLPLNKKNNKVQLKDNNLIKEYFVYKVNFDLFLKASFCSEKEVHDVIFYTL
jgi:4'-phosphopantetheinyl transferase